MIGMKPIESIQTAISLFDEKTGQWKSKSPSNNDELENEQEHEVLLRDLANTKVQLDVKDSTYKQALLKLDLYKRTINDLSTLLKESEFEKDAYIKESREARLHAEELESMVKDMDDKLLETAKIQEQLSHAIRELKATRAEQLSIETELAMAKEAKREALTQAELMETALHMEKERTEELLRHVSELKETILHSKLAAIEVENEKCDFLEQKEAEILAKTEAIIEAQEQLESMREQLENLHDLQDQLLTKSTIIDTLQMEVKLGNELKILAEKAASNAAKELNQIKSNLEFQENKNLDQAGYISLLEAELTQVKRELINAKDEVILLDDDFETMAGELKKIKGEMNESREKENEAQVELAMLKSQVHRGRSKIAAAEAGEARAKSEKSALQLALQQLAIEAEEAKKENKMLKENAAKKSSKISVKIKAVETDCLETECVEKIDETITISKEEYEVLVKKAERADQRLLRRFELETLRKDLENAMVRMGGFRTRAEQAMSRAEAAEKAKAALEERIRKSKEKRRRKKAAIAALREESTSGEITCLDYNNSLKTYQPLGKVLNLKF